MGYEHYIAKPEKKEYFCLGKGDYAEPLIEVGINDYRPDIHTTNNLMLEHSRFFVDRLLLGADRDLWIGFYVEHMKEHDRGGMDEDYWREVAGKVWDWMDKDNCWVYGDHFFECVEYKEWKETGTRYTG